MIVSRDEQDEDTGHVDSRGRTSNALDVQLQATDRATTVRPYVTFLTRQDARERIHRWIDYLCSTDENESSSLRQTKATCLSQLEKMLVEGNLTDPFLQEPPSTLDLGPTRAEARASNSPLRGAERPQARSSPSSPTVDVSQRLVALSGEAKTALKFADPRGGIEADWLRSRDDDVDSLLSGPTSAMLPLQMREAHLHSELLNIQSQHQTEMEEMVWEKNRELEDLRNSLHKQLQEVAAKRLEKEILCCEVQQEKDLLQRESESAMTSLRSELKKTADASHEKHMECLQELVIGHQEERERCKMEHKEALKTIGADVESRLQRLQDDYCQRITSQGDQIKELQTKLFNCGKHLQRMTEDLRCLEEEREFMDRREREVNKELSTWKAKLSTLTTRKKHLEETADKERSSIEEEFKQLLEAERSESTSASRIWHDTRDRLTADLIAAKERLVTMEEANAAVMREGADTNRRVLEELRHTFETRLSDASRRHETAAAILRDKLTSRMDESQCAAGELARVEMELESARRRSEEEIAHLQARYTMESARQLEAVRNDLETLKKELSACERGRDRQRAESETTLRVERARLAAEAEGERSQVERERANLRVKAARELEELRLRHEQELEEMAGPLTLELTAAGTRGSAAQAASHDRIATLAQEENLSRQTLEAARAGRREALLAIGRDRREDMAQRCQAMVAELEEVRQKAAEEMAAMERRLREEKAQVEIQFNRSVEELSLRHSARMEEALSLTTRLDDCVRGLVDVNQSLSERLRDVCIASSQGLERC